MGNAIGFLKKLQIFREIKMGVSHEGKIAQNNGRGRRLDVPKRGITDI